MTDLNLALRADSNVLERRSIPLDDYEIRENKATGGWTFEGVASTVDVAYPVRDQFGEYNETIARGAFDSTLRDKKANVSLYLNHQHHSLALSSRRAGMELVADPHLRIKAELNPRRSDVENVKYAIEDRILTEMSIGFVPVKARDKWNEDYTEVKRTQVSLREVSIVEAGANVGGTSASMRSFDDFMATTLTDVDMSTDEVKRAIAFFQARLAELEPIDETAEEPRLINPFAERDRLDAERLERRRLLRPPAA